MRIDRRDLLGLGMAGAALLPARALAQTRGFTHGVASGEPGQTGMLFWTRYVGAGDARLTLEVAEGGDIAKPVRTVPATARADSDHIARVRVEGLHPGHRYYYRFTAADGSRSIIGRTRTLPRDRPDHFRIAVFSCSNVPFGFFNAYAHAVAADDADLVVHLGDYIYEYPRGTYPTAEQSIAGRNIDPPSETISLADYRARYATYRADADLQALHAHFPSITIWDDHEIANDAWVNGAQNHQGEEGDWQVRKRAAMQAYREWLPMDERAYAAYPVADLATLIRLDTRIEGRGEQLTGELAALIASGADDGRIAAFRDSRWAATERSLLGTAQEAWLAGQLRSSRARWQLLVQQVVMGALRQPPGLSPDALGPNAPASARARLTAGARVSALGLPFNLDAWDGYPAARDRLLAAAQAAGSNLIVLAGDTHNCWAFDLDRGGTPVGVEFATPAVSSAGLETFVSGMSMTALEQAFVGANPQLKWCELSRRGYMLVDISADAVRCDWRLLDTVRTRSTKLADGYRAAVAHGSRRLTLGG